MMVCTEKERNLIRHPCLFVSFTRKYHSDYGIISILQNWSWDGIRSHTFHLLLEIVLYAPMRTCYFYFAHSNHYSIAFLNQEMRPQLRLIMVFISCGYELNIQLRILVIPFPTLMVTTSTPLIFNCGSCSRHFQSHYQWRKTTEVLIERLIWCL